MQMQRGAASVPGRSGWCGGGARRTEGVGYSRRVEGDEVGGLLGGAAGGGFAVEPGPKVGELSELASLGGAAVGVPGFCRLVKVPEAFDVGLEAGMEGDEVVEGEVGDGAALALGELDGGAGDVVGLAKRDVFADEVLGEVGREHLVGEGGAHLVGVDGEGVDDAGGDGEGEPEGVGDVEDGLLVFLEVLVVGGGQRGDEGDESRGGGREAGGLAADELEGVGVALLGHQGGAGRVALPEGDEAELAAAVDD
mmetsp:Transcript_13633/g.43056  ORF Transcript_13633/g.43056 Transcript_13633/m.43056 type:complete len:252 (-) Transcript_13633:879-1634(-)